ncbi:uncharacterized protein BKA78DRAFT_313333 [Phyllosticta capitalensis]|uniref:uncharacterized protein n=1 Tax=Phyllosticta capitalensis TaxID=121624 RepID=UPI0031315AC9
MENGHRATGHIIPARPPASPLFSALWREREANQCSSCHSRHDGLRNKKATEAVMMPARPPPHLR